VQQSAYELSGEPELVDEVIVVDAQFASAPEVGFAGDVHAKYTIAVGVPSEVNDAQTFCVSVATEHGRSSAFALQAKYVEACEVHLVVAASQSPTPSAHVSQSPKAEPHFASAR
jgi:hypothetical protein